MASSILRQRIAWLATAILFVACASAPEPTATKRKKKRKSDRSALKKKKKKVAQAEKEAQDEQPDKPKRDSVTITDDDSEDEATTTKKKSSDDESDEGSSKAKRKKDEEREEVASKSKRKKELEEEAKRKKEEEAEEAKRKKEEEAEEAAAKAKRKKELEDEEAEQAAAKSKRKKDVDAEEASFKRKKDEDKVAAKSRKNDEDVESVEDADVEAEEKPAKKKDKVAAKSKAEPAEVDMSGPPSDADVIEMETDEEPPAGERRVAAIPVPGVDSAEEEEQVEVIEPLPPGATPRAINDRPLTLGKGKLSVHGGLRVGVLTLPNLAGMDVSTTTQSFALGGTYGVGDKLEVGLDYTLGLSPGRVRGPFTIHGAYRASTSAKLDIAIGASLAIDSYDTTDPVTMQTTTRTLASVGLGAWARYRLTRKLSLFTGLPALPDSTVALTKLSLPLPPLPYHLAIGLNGGGAIAFDLPVGVGYQASPKLYAFVDLDLVHYSIKNTPTAFLFKDFIPLQLGAFYALSKLDLGISFSDDLKQGFDYLRFDTVLRYSIK